MDLPVKWHFFETKIRHEISISNKCLGHVLNVTFCLPFLWTVIRMTKTKVMLLFFRFTLPLVALC